MNKYYVIKIGKHDEWECGKFDSLTDAIKVARQEWNHLTANEKKLHKIEIRQYEEDIEDENCTNYSYDTFEWGYLIREYQTGELFEKVNTIEEAKKYLWENVKNDIENHEEDEDKALDYYEIYDNLTHRTLSIGWDYANDSVKIY